MMMWAGQCSWPQSGGPRTCRGVCSEWRTPDICHRGKTHLWSWLCHSWAASGRSLNCYEPQHLIQMMGIISTWWWFQKMCSRSQTLIASERSKWCWVLQKKTQITHGQSPLGNQHPSLNPGEKGEAWNRLSFIAPLYSPSPKLPRSPLINWTSGNRAQWGFSSALNSNALSLYTTWPISSYFHLYHLI